MTEPHQRPALSQQAIFCRRRHQPRRPAPAKIRPGSPAPAMGAGTGAAAVAMTCEPVMGNSTFVKTPDGSVTDRNSALGSVRRQCEQGGDAQKSANVVPSWNKRLPEAAKL